MQQKIREVATPLFFHLVSRVTGTFFSGHTKNKLTRTQPYPKTFRQKQTKTIPNPNRKTQQFVKKEPTNQPTVETSRITKHKKH